MHQEGLCIIESLVIALLAKISICCDQIDYAENCTFSGKCSIRNLLSLLNLPSLIPRPCVLVMKAVKKEVAEIADNSVGVELSANRRFQPWSF